MACYLFFSPNYFYFSNTRINLFLDLSEYLLIEIILFIIFLLEIMIKYLVYSVIATVIAILVAFYLRQVNNFVSFSFARASLSMFQLHFTPLAAIFKSI